MSDSDEELRKSFINLKSFADICSLLEMNNKQLEQHIYSNHQQKKYHSFKIKKRNGGNREICAPSPYLKEIQRRLNHILKLVYRPKSCVKGFVKGESIIQNAKLHVGKSFLLNVDLSNFFNSINFGRVRGLFTSQAFNFNNEVATILSQFCTFENKLPQGAPTSPIISNLICFNLDRALQKLAKKYNLVYTRYADDITFSTDLSRFPRAIAFFDADGNTNLGQEIIDIIHENGFKINFQKIRLLQKYNRQEVTGLTVNEFPNVQRKFIRQIRAMLHAWEVYGYQKAEEVHHYQYYSRQNFSLKKKASFDSIVKGKLDFIRQVRGENDNVYFKLVSKAHELDPIVFKLPVVPPLSIDKRQELYNKFLELKDLKQGGNVITAQARGYHLQDLFQDLFKLHNIHVIESFTRNDSGEQIDGAFKFDSWHYLVECRWKTKLSDIRELDGLKGQLDRSGKQTIGFFISIQGWSKNVISLLKQNPSKNIVLMNGEDLEEILKQNITLSSAIQKKNESLNFRAEPYCSLRLA